MTSSAPATENNGTTMEEKFDDKTVLISTTFLVIIIIKALFGNVLVVIAFAVFQKLRNMTNYFIVSLAVADILVAAVSMPVWGAYLITGPRWMFDSWIQKVHKSFIKSPPPVLFYPPFFSLVPHTYSKYVRRTPSYKPVFLSGGLLAIYTPCVDSFTDNTHGKMRAMSKMSTSIICNTIK